MLRLCSTAAYISLFVSATCVFAAPQSSGNSERDREIIEIADAVANAYQAKEGYREIPSESFEAQAKEKSLSLRTSLATGWSDRYGFSFSTKMPSKKNLMARLFIFVTAVPALAILPPALHVPELHTWTEALGGVWLYGSIALIAMEKTRPIVFHILVAPEHAWFGAKKLWQKISLRLRSTREQREVRYRLGEELQKRRVPVDFSEGLCGELLSGEPEVEIVEQEK